MQGPDAAGGYGRTRHQLYKYRRLPTYARNCQTTARICFSKLPDWEGGETFIIEVAFQVSSYVVVAGNLAFFGASPNAPVKVGT